MNPEENQLDLFGNVPVSDPALLHPESASTDTDPKEFHNRSPTLNAEQEKLARSLHRKSRELVKKSRCFNNIQQHENIQSNEHTGSGDHQGGL